MIDLKNVSGDTHIDGDNFCSALKIIDLSCRRGDKAKFNSILECVYSLKPLVFRNLGFLTLSQAFERLLFLW
jgi:hypothetical protein